MDIKRYKYPRTPHLPWSPGGSSDDIRKTSTEQFVGKNIVVTEKMDGENTTMYCDHIHARSIDSRHHPSRDWVKRLHAELRHHIQPQWRLCGENVYAKHSIAYDELPSYFLLFSIWDQRNVCLSWADTLEWAELLGLETPQVFYQGLWTQQWFDDFAVDTTICEGYVVRLAEEFHYDQFGQSIAKWVRASHVQSDQHWMYSEIEANRLKGDDNNE